MTSRATRVWKVVEVPSSEDDDKPLDGPVMVLKDMWLDSQSKTERENLDAIFEKLESISHDLKNGKELKFLAKFDDVSKEAAETCLKAGTWGDHFLTVVCDWKGSSSKAVPVGARPDQTLFDPLPSCPKPASVQYCDPTRCENAREMDAATPIQTPLSRTYSPKQHYRVVFKEICESLHDVKGVQDVATALGGAVLALQLMFLAGWIHRDISTGNIFACRLHADGSPGAPGTAFFMAIEIQRQIYIYRPDASMEFPPVDSDQEQQGSPAQTDPESSGVIHNFEHDMESVFWVLLWTLLVRFPPARSDAQKAAFSKDLSSIFQNSGSCSPGREKIFTNKQTFETFLRTWLNPALQSMRFSLLNLRAALAIGYHKRGYNFNDRASYARLYAYLWKAIRACGQIQLAPSLTTENIEVYPALAKMKRRGSAQDDKNNPKPARVEYNTDATSARMTEPLDPEDQFQRENA
ncbi:hypothetical protein FRC00_007541 [Tulasnella sp. 408]|nr:hypothetical protein FRC00_007541 [Tulasnella sp. 408]